MVHFNELRGLNQYKKALPNVCP